MSYDRELFDAQLKASIELEELRKREKVTQAHSLEVLVKLYTRVIDQLEEELSYEKLKSDAYRMVWSAREYIRATYWDYTSWASTNHILANALNTLDAERVDGVAIREKYNPKVVKLKRTCCERDNDGDGNCDIHSSPGVYRGWLNPSGSITGRQVLKDGHRKTIEYAPGHKEPEWTRYNGPKC